MPGLIRESATARGRAPVKLGALRRHSREEGEMAIATRPARPVERPQALPKHHFWGTIGKFVRTKPLGAAGAAIIVLMALTAVCADLIAPYDVYEINQQLQFAPP